MCRLYPVCSNKEEGEVRQVNQEIRHGLWYSVRNAWIGVSQIAKGRMFLMGLVFGIGAIAFSWIFDLTMFDRIAVITFSFLVLCFEGFNSALEKLLDLLAPSYTPQVRVIKDMLAGAVLVGAIGAIIVGGLILLRVLGVF